MVLLVVGDGPAREDLEKQTRELQMQDHVRFIGEVDHSEVPDYYRAADIFVSASDSESQGLTYIEALAAGRKVVAFAGEYTNSLLDDPAIGTTFTVQSELVHQVVNYLKHPQAFDDPAPREVKLRAISADLFGDRVLKVYQDATRRFQDEQTLRDEALDDSTLKG